MELEALWTSKDMSQLEMDPGLCAISHPLGPAGQEHGQHLSGMGSLGSQISVSHSTGVWGSWGSGGLAAGMARNLMGIGSI